MVEWKLKLKRDMTAKGAAEAIARLADALDLSKATGGDLKRLEHAVWQDNGTTGNRHERRKAAAMARRKR